MPYWVSYIKQDKNVGAKTEEDVELETLADEDILGTRHNSQMTNVS